MLHFINLLTIVGLLLSYGRPEIVHADEENLHHISKNNEIKMEKKKPVFETILEINKRANLSNVLYQGDIRLNPFRNAHPEGRWPKRNRNGLVYVPYTISKEYSSQQRAEIKEAFNVYKKHTCIRFVPNNSRNRASILIKSEPFGGCSSYVGRQGGKDQIVSLSIPSCVQRGIILHELMHAIGFEHEQSRSDRDQYVRVIYENIPFGKENNNFAKLNDSLNLVVYDYTSVMHYTLHGQGRFEILPSLEIFPKRNPEPKVGFRENLSAYDIEEIKYYYDCVMGTYERCGRDFVNQSFGSFQSPSYPNNYPSESHCTWNITVSSQRFVKVTFTDIDIENSTLCQLDAIIVHDGINANASAFRRICGRIQNLTITSTGNSIFIIFTSNAIIANKGFRATFREVTIRGSSPPPIPTAPPVPVISPSNYVTEFQCKFDSDFCGMTQDTLDDLDFQISTRNIPDESDGYMSLKSSPIDNNGDNAVIRTPWFRSGKTRLCIQFAYRTDGNYIGGLRVYAFEQRKNDTIGQRKLLWEKFGSQGPYWRSDSLYYSPDNNLTNVENVQFYWEGYVRNHTSYIGVDDIKVQAGECVYSTRKCDYIYVDDDACRFKEVTTNRDTFSWKMQNGPTPTKFTGPPGDHTNGYGFYKYSSKSTSSQGWRTRAEDNAVLQSPPLTYETHCFSLWYHMNGENIGNLTVYKLINGIKYAVAEVVGSQEDRWKLLQVEINTSIPGINNTQSNESNNLKITGINNSTILRPFLKVGIEATAGSGYRRDIAIDDIVITDHPCPPQLDLKTLPNKFICNFESEGDLCGLQQTTEDQTDWERKSGNAGAIGPLVDSTLRNASGHYIFASPNTAERGALTRISTPNIRPGHYCVQFSYHINGKGSCTSWVNSLDGATAQPKSLWSGFNKQENRWRQASQQYVSNSNDKALQFTFVSNNWKGSSCVVAFDDIRIVSGMCSPLVTTPRTVRQLPPALTNGRLLWSGMPLCTFENKTTQNVSEPNSGDTTTVRLNDDDMGPYILSTDVQSDNLCGWRQIQQNDNLAWTRSDGSPSNFGAAPGGDETSGNGYYLYLEPSSSVRFNNRAILATYLMPASDYCINLNYHMTGFPNSRYGKLRVRAIETFASGSRGRPVLLNLDGDLGNRWNYTQIDYTAPSKALRIAFRLEGFYGSNRSHVAVDDVSILPGRCGVCQYPNHRLISSSDQEQWFSAGCVHTGLFYVRCCDSYPLKAVYRRVQNCSVNTFSSSQLSGLCQDY